jgi:hypothetical protein
MKIQVASYFRARIAAFLTTFIIVAGQTWIAYIIEFNFVWILPLVSGVMLTVSIIAYSGSDMTPSKSDRTMSILVLVILTLSNILCIGWFIYDMLNPDTVTISYQLLLVGFSLWIVNIGVFSLAYWELDSGGPEVRALKLPTVFRKKIYPDFVFEQQMSSDSKFVPPDWSPGFLDYVYLSFTAAIAFSPDTPKPYTRMAKMMLAAESLISLFIIGLIISRAISL